MEQREVAPREFSRAGLAGGILVLVVAALAIGGGYWLSTKLRQREQSPQGVAEAMLRDRKAAPFFEALRDNYPEELASYSTLVSRRVRERATRDQLAQESFDWMRATTLRHRDEFVQAPHGDLNLYRQMEIQLLETLQSRDVALCGRYLMGTLSPGSRQSAEVSERLIELAAARITTSAAGRDHPVHRKVPKDDIATADAVALIAAMRRRGMTEQDLETWGNGVRMMQAPPQQQCAIGLYVLRGITDLPHVQADRITGWLSYQQKG